MPASWLRVMLALGGEISVAVDPLHPNEWLGFTMSIGAFDHPIRLECPQNIKAMALVAN